MLQEKRNKVLLLTKWYPNKYDPQLGVFIQKQAKAISQHSDITVFYPQAAQENSHSTYEIVVNRTPGFTEYIVYYPKNTMFFSPLVHAFRYWKSWKKIWNLLIQEKNKPELIHAYILLRPVLLAWWISIRENIPYVVSEQWSGYTNGRFQKKSWIVRKLSTLLANRANGRTVVSQFLKRNMLKSGFNEPLTVIPNIIDSHAAGIAPAKNHPSLMKKILVVADLVDDIKNISGILLAFQKIHGEFPNTELRIVGGGRDEAMLKELAGKLFAGRRVVLFEGLKSNSEVYNFLRECDFLIVNSRFETFSLICAEAMSCGKPVIATKCGGPEEFITEQTGILIPVNDEIKLIEAMRNMLNQSIQFQSEFIKAYAIDHFSEEKASFLFKNVYAAAIEK